MTNTVSSVSKAAVDSTATLGFEIRQEQLEVIVLFVLGKDVVAVL